MEFPSSYREQLEDPEYIAGEWRTYALSAYDPEWALSQGEYAFEYIDKHRRDMGYFDPDEYVIYLKQYWYNRGAPQPLWYTGRKAPGAAIVWQMEPGGKQQASELKLQKEWGTGR